MQRSIFLVVKLIDVNQFIVSIVTKMKVAPFDLHREAAMKLIQHLFWSLKLDKIG
jgi:hypothetical protein